MKNINKIFIILITLIVTLSFIIAFITNKSFIESNFNKILEGNLNIQFNLSNKDYNKLFKLNDLIENSDLIAIVTLDNNKEKNILQYSTIGQYKIKESFKGNKNSDDIIKIYEKSYLEYYYQNTEQEQVSYIITSETNHNFMNEYSEYIVFLKKTQNPIPGDNTDTYMIVDDTFGIFKLDENIKSKIIDESKLYNYKDLEIYDVFFQNDDIKNKYNELKEKVLDKYQQNLV